MERKRLTIGRSLHLINSQPISLPEVMKTGPDYELCESITKLWCTGKSDREVENILNLTDTKFLELVALIKTTDTGPQTAQATYAGYVYEYEKFKSRTESRLDELSNLLKLHQSGIQFLGSQRIFDHHEEF
jgi:hypothetical protein